VTLYHAYTNAPVGDQVFSVLSCLLFFSLALYEVCGLANDVIGASIEFENRCCGEREKPSEGKEDDTQSDVQSSVEMGRIPKQSSGEPELPKSSDDSSWSGGLLSTFSWEQKPRGQLVASQVAKDNTSL